MSSAFYPIRRVSHLLRYAIARPSSVYYCGWIGYGNLGDEAMFRVVRDTLAPLRVAGARLPAKPAVLRKRLAQKRHRAALLGGGTMIVRPSGDAGPRFFERFRDAVSHHGAGIVFGTGVHARNPETDLADWKPLLDSCLFLGVRGAKSADLLQRIGVQADVIGDPAAGFVQSPEFWQPEDRTLGINTGSLSMGATHPQQGRFESQIVNFVQERCRAGWSIEFFCVYPGDLATIKRVASMAGIARPVVHEHYWDARAFLHSARRMSVFVGTKLHSAILALCAGVPTISIGYQFKCQDFMSSVGADRYCIPLDQLGNDLFSARFNEIVSDGDSQRRCTLAALGAFRTAQRTAAGRIREILAP